MTSPPALTARPASAVGYPSGGRGSGTPLYLWVLLGALAAGTVAQGGYYAAGRILVGVAVAAAAVLAWRARETRPDGSLRPVAAAATALGLWILARGVQSGEYGDAVAALATLGCAVAALAVLRRTGDPDREQFASALIGFGALVAFGAWAGVAWRLPRLAVLVDHSVWRGGSTLTYPNAAAALLTALCLLAIALLVADPRSRYRLLCAYLMLAGLGATASRAGGLALLAGIAVLAVLAGPRAVAARAAAPVLGGLVAFGTLTPSFATGGTPHPLVAVAGLAGGAVLTLGLTVGRRWVRAVAWAVTLVLAGAALAGQAASPAMRHVLDSRWSLASSGRSMAARAALDAIRAHPLAGTGIGRGWLFWQTPDGNVEAARYVHDEYLQILVDLGAVGAIGLACLVAALVTVLRREWTVRPRSALRIGAVAALAAFAVHSGFDFLWHIPVLPLVAGLCLGLATAAPGHGAEAAGPGGTDAAPPDGTEAARAVPGTKLAAAAAYGRRDSTRRRPPAARRTPGGSSTRKDNR